jgi:hypothetical protein
MQQLFFRIAAIKIGMAAINDRKCSNKYLRKGQLIIGKAVIINQECGNYLLELHQE